MNAATDLRPQVAEFLRRVREQLTDLTVEECDELLDGLDADLSEQLAEGGALPDPAAYAAELRAAAGLSPGRPSRRVRLSGVELLDRSRASWMSWTERHRVTREAWAVAELLRPAWWVARAWVAVTLLDQSLGPWEYVSLWPTLGAPLVGPLLLVAAVVVSMLIGQGRLWPGSGPTRPASARVVLVVLNALAVVAPFTFAGDGSHAAAYVGSGGYAAGYHDASHRPGLRHGTDVVRNIYPYDLEGRPLQGVQLFDQKGRAVAVSPVSSTGRGANREVTCPWFNGATPLYNVYPLPQRAQRRGTCLGQTDPAKVGPQGFHEPPLASVPPATLPSPDPQAG